ncbi:uncharacterized protein LTR77_008741 [Saxophila tyrrhenica]|uniref:Uncharacterized protein n=1 Tax=Saxophila tyrrhenica TaxID=1690608 RepID=A0AAV9P023_9PEZI|nr:hypothetical protein LTR77_008741 [Saxophila tyrrhenica]
MDFQDTKWQSPSSGRRPKPPLVTKFLRRAVWAIVISCLTTGAGMRAVKHGWWRSHEDDLPFPWQQFRKLDGYYNGLNTLVPYEDWRPQNGWNVTSPLQLDSTGVGKKTPTMDPVVYDPYPDFASPEYLSEHQPVAECFLDEDDTVRVPDVYAYPGLPQHFPRPLYGSNSELEIREDVCFDRFGRYGPYGYSYDDGLREHGLRTTPEDEAFQTIVGSTSENAGAEKIFELAGYTSWTGMDWGAAQDRCIDKNKARFAHEQPSRMKRTPRHAFVLRTWTGRTYNQHSILALRALISELALKSRGQYTVHLLIHVRDSSIPIFADEAIYNATLQSAVPREFWGISTLWSEAQMKMLYPGPFDQNFDAGVDESTVHGVYRSAHFALQWFSRMHPEYEFFWNWEMDVRFTGHYWEFAERVGEWARKQARKGLWERNGRFWLPEVHGSYDNFTTFVEREIETVEKEKNNGEQSGPIPVWGPLQQDDDTPPDSHPPTPYPADNYTWGVDSPADLITFTPLFDPAHTTWVLRNDITNYPSPPPRRASIITVSRLSRRLLAAMHDEVVLEKRTMFTEMFPASVALQEGMKAVFAPVGVWFDRDWNSAYAEQVLNRPEGKEKSAFGWGEHNLLGGTFYYNARFGPRLWRRWLGLRSEAWDGWVGERGEEGGRLCLPGLLVHPVKDEGGRGG